MTIAQKLSSHLHLPARFAVLLIALLCGSYVAFPAYALAADQEQQGTETTTIGRVTRVQGISFIRRGGELRDVAVGGDVQRGDSLNTGPRARMELTMLDETKLTMGADTVFSLDRYDLGSQRGAGSVVLKLVKGTFRAATGRLEALRGGPFEVETPLGVIGIRGTDFWGGYLSAEEVSVLLISGSGVYVKNSAGMSEIVKPGFGITLRAKDTPPPASSMWSPDKTARAYKTVTFD